MDRGERIWNPFPATLIDSLTGSLQQPELIAGWQKTITDAPLRVRVFASLARERVASDPFAAPAYAENFPNIRSEERLNVCAAFDADFNSVSLAP